MHSNVSPDPHLRSSIGEGEAAWQFSVDLLAAWHMSRVLSCALWGVCRLQSREHAGQTERTDTHTKLRVTWLHMHEVPAKGINIYDRQRECSGCLRDRRSARTSSKLVSWHDFTEHRSAAACSTSTFPALISVCLSSLPHQCNQAREHLQHSSADAWQERPGVREHTA